MVGSLVFHYWKSSKMYLKWNNPSKIVFSEKRSWNIMLQVDQKYLWASLAVTNINVGLASQPSYGKGGEDHQVIDHKERTQSFLLAPLCFFHPLSSLHHFLWWGSGLEIPCVKFTHWLELCYGNNDVRKVIHIPAYVAKLKFIFMVVSTFQQE